MNLTILNNKRLALLLWKPKEDSPEEDDVCMYGGTIRVRGQDIFFDRGTDIPPLALRPEWVERIKKIPKSLIDTLGNNEYQLSLLIEDLPPGEDGSSFLPTGLKWID